MKSIELTFTYKNKQIPYNIYKNDDNLSISNVVFLGAMQVQKIPQWVAQSCPPGTVVIGGAPHWQVESEANDLIEFMIEYIKNTILYLVNNLNASGFNVIGESQSTPALIYLFAQDEFKQYAKKIILLQPLGFTSNTFCYTSDANIKIFKKRIISNMRYQLPSGIFDKRYRYNVKLLKNTVDFNKESTISQYSSGLSYDSMGDLANLYEVNKNITVISGAKDKLFPVQDIQRQLKACGMDIELLTVKGIPHTSLATRQGRHLLNKAFSII